MLSIPDFVSQLWRKIMLSIPDYLSQIWRKIMLSIPDFVSQLCFSKAVRQNPKWKAQI